MPARARDQGARGAADDARGLGRGRRCGRPAGRGWLGARRPCQRCAILSSQRSTRYLRLEADSLRGRSVGLHQRGRHRTRARDHSTVLKLRGVPMCSAGMCSADTSWLVFALTGQRPAPWRGGLERRYGWIVGWLELLVGAYRQEPLRSAFSPRGTRCRGARLVGRADHRHARPEVAGLRASPRASERGALPLPKDAGGCLHYLPGEAASVSTGDPVVARGLSRRTSAPRTAAPRHPATA